MRQPGRRAPAWLRRQYAHGRCDGELRRVRREACRQEIEEDTGIRFGVVEAHQFAAIPVVSEDGQMTALGFEASKVFVESPEGRRLYRHEGPNSGFAPAKLSRKKRSLFPKFCGTAGGDRQDAAKACRAPGDQGRRRASLGSSAPSGARQPRVQGALGPNQVQDHLPCCVRQRRLARANAPTRSGKPR